MLMHPSKYIVCFLLFLLLAPCSCAQDDKGKESSDELGKDPKGVTWGMESGGIQASISKRDRLTFTQPPGPIMIAGTKVIDVQKQLVVREFDAEYGGGPTSLGGNGKYFAATDKGKNASGASVIVWDTETGKEVLRIDQSEINNFVDNLIMVRDRYVAVAGRSDNIVKVWNVETGEKVKELSTKSECRKIGDGQLAFTQDGNYCAIVADERIEVISVATGKMAAYMQTSSDQEVFVNAWIQDLQFSPDSQEIAAVTTHPDPTLLVWNNRGKLVVKRGYKLPGRKAFWEHKFQWLPDGSGWLIAGSLLDRQSQRIVMSIEEEFARDLSVFVKDENHLIGRFSDNSTVLRSAKIPWDDIRKSLAAIESDDENYLSPSKPVSIKFEFEKLRGDSQSAIDLLTKALTERLSKDGFKVIEGADTYFLLRFSEAAGDTLPIYESQFPGLMFGGRDTGRKATEAKGQLIIELFTPHSNKPLYRESVKGQSSRTFSEEINDQSIRTSMLRSLRFQLDNLNIPYFIPKDKSMKGLPLIIR